jgi:hypothetical protein
MLSVTFLGKALALKPTGKGFGAVEDRTQLCDPCIDLIGTDFDALPLRCLAHELLFDHEVHGLATQPI